jgi:hypothetical protein
MNGIFTITRTNQIYIIRNDSGYGKDYWAWNIYDDSGAHVPVTKWKKLPKGRRPLFNQIILFDLDDPPRTISWNPLLE